MDLKVKEEHHNMLSEQRMRVMTRSQNKTTESEVSMKAKQDKISATID